MIYTYYTAGSDGSWHNHHRMGSVEGICLATSAGSIGAGSHTVSIRVDPAASYGSRRDCYTGWNNHRGMIAVKEIPR